MVPVVVNAEPMPNICRNYAEVTGGWNAGVHGYDANENRPQDGVALSAARDIHRG